MVCAATDDRASFDSIESWLHEVRIICPDIPIVLALTKSDLQDAVPDCVTEQELINKMERLGLQGAWVTSSDHWENFNVHKAFE